MASSSNYKVLLQTELNIKEGLAKARVQAAKEKLEIGLKFNMDGGGKVLNDVSQIEARFKEIKATTDQLASMTATKNPLGIVDQYTLTYMDQYKNKYAEIYRLTETTDSLTGKTTQSWIMRSKVTDGIAARQKELLAAEKQEAAVTEQQAKAQAKIADEMERYGQRADEFLAKSKNMAQTPAVNAVVAKAQEIKVAISEGDINKVRQLNDEFKTMQAGLSSTKVGLQSWSESIGRAIKQTVSYAASVGLVYGAMNQLRQGLQYVIDLNKEMTNIQVLQIEGVKSATEVATLANKYNLLARELGVTTLEVAKGSTEWLRQGKSIQETQELLRSTLMLSKLGALESAQATEYLTAIINGFNMEANQSEDVVNKLVAIDNIAATSAGIFCQNI